MKKFLAFIFLSFLFDGLNAAEQSPRPEGRIVPVPNFDLADRVRGAAAVRQDRERSPLREEYAASPRTPEQRPRHGIVPIPDFERADRAAAGANAVAVDDKDDQEGFRLKSIKKTRRDVLRQQQERLEQEYENYRNAIISQEPGWMGQVLEPRNQWMARQRGASMPRRELGPIEPQNTPLRRAKPMNQPLAGTLNGQPVGLTVSGLLQQPFLGQPGGRRLQRLLNRLQRQLEHQNLAQEAAQIPLVEVLYRLKNNDAFTSLINELEVPLDRYSQMQKGLDARQIRMRKAMEALNQPAHQPQQAPLGLRRNLQQALQHPQQRTLFDQAAARRHGQLLFE